MCEDVPGEQEFICKENTFVELFIKSIWRIRNENGFFPGFVRLLTKHI
jgi:hypothetical protein